MTYAHWLQAERSRKEEEEEEEKRLQAEEEHQRQQRMAQEQEAIARAEERRHAAHEAAMEKKRAEKVCRAWLGSCQKLRQVEETSSPETALKDFITRDCTTKLHFRN